MSHRENVYISLKAPAASPDSPNATQAYVTAEVRVFFPPTLEGLAVAEDLFVEATRQAAEKLEQCSSRSEESSLIRVPHHEARKGDVAEHKSGQLDPRLIAEIDIEANAVWLEMGEEKIGPFQADNYRYLRHVRQQEAQ